jgi:RNA polymerase sigma-70 factor (ECF subfamily)
MDGLNDDELARRARKGDKNALAALVERLRLPLFALAYDELRHYADAQDAVAGALVRVCRHIGHLRDPARVRPWLRNIVRNEAHRLRERRPPLPAFSVSATPDLDNVSASNQHAAHSPDDDDVLLRIDVERALSRLPRDQARALALFYLAGLPIREIARRTERPEGTVKYWLHHGRRRLAHELKGYAPMTTTEPQPTTPPLPSSPGGAPATATIISTDMEPALLQALSDALSASGWTQVNLVRDWRALGQQAQALPDPLGDSGLIFLDERLDGRPAWELFALLKAAERTEPDNGRRPGFCLFFSPTHDQATDRITVAAAYVSGFDLLFGKPFDPAEVARYASPFRDAAPSPASETEAGYL